MKNDQVLIIAEAGVNHNGDEACALALVDAAAVAGADVVKFQTFRAERLVTRTAAQATYQVQSTGRAETQLTMLKRLELPDSVFGKLMARCRDRGIEFLSTPFDLESLVLLDRLGVDRIKLGSGEITNLPLLRASGRLGKPVLLSTGMSHLAEVRAALQVLLDAGLARQLLTLLHCNTEYPTPLCDVNLKAMCTLAQELDVAVGYSDHTEGFEAALAAVALGARVIEKHFTLDRKLPGPDHRASLEPDELAAMVRAIRNVETTLGDGVKRPSPSELRNRDVARRSLVAAQPIACGERFTEHNLAAKRPGTGLSPMHWDAVLGKPAKRDYETDEQIQA